MKFLIKFYPINSLFQLNSAELKRSRGVIPKHWWKQNIFLWEKRGTIVIDVEQTQSTTNKWYCHAAKKIIWVVSVSQSNFTLGRIFWKVGQDWLYISHCICRYSFVPPHHTLSIVNCPNARAICAPWIQWRIDVRTCDLHASY